MAVINLVALSQFYHQTQNASSSQEALLSQVIAKIVTVEALAMAKLSQKLSPKMMEQLRKRILALKAKASQLTSFEEMTAFPLASLSAVTAMSDGQITHDDSAVIAAQVSCVTAYKTAQYALKSTPLSKVKTLLGLERSPQDKSSLYYPTLSFKQRGKTAGSAYLQRWEIRLNPILLAENRTQFIQEVIPHEYAHLLTFALYGAVQPHGKEWQSMMTEIMGLPAERTHTFNTQNSVTRRYERFTYHCLCQSHALTAIRHNRIQSGKMRYTCKQCGAPLRQD